VSVQFPQMQMQLLILGMVRYSPQRSRIMLLLIMEDSSFLWLLLLAKYKLSFSLLKMVIWFVSFVFVHELVMGFSSSVFLWLN
jgi:hypothetical protein